MLHFAPHYSTEPLKVALHCDKLRQDTNQLQSGVCLCQVYLFSAAVEYQHCSWLIVMLSCYPKCYQNSKLNIWQHFQNNTTDLVLNYSALLRITLDILLESLEPWITTSTHSFFVHINVCIFCWDFISLYKHTLRVY